ncbi:hypothetical protein V1505DRAFT_377322 [Lipomyces doorenjongii]
MVGPGTDAAFLQRAKIVSELNRQQEYASMPKPMPDRPKSCTISAWIGFLERMEGWFKEDKERLFKIRSDAREGKIAGSAIGAVIAGVSTACSFGIGSAVGGVLSAASVISSDNVIARANECIMKHNEELVRIGFEIPRLHEYLKRHSDIIKSHDDAEKIWQGRDSSHAVQIHGKVDGDVITVDSVNGSAALKHRMELEVHAEMERRHMQMTQEYAERTRGSH